MSKAMTKSKTTKARDAQKQSSRRFLYGVIAFVVFGALVIAVVSNRSETEKADVATQTATVSVTGQPLPAYAGQGSADASVGTKIPDLTGTTLDGDAIAIKDDGQAKVLLFAAHWCPHCQKEIPLLAPDLRANPLPDNVDLYTVSTSVNPTAPNYPPSAWFEREQWPTPVIADDESGTAAQAYGLDGFPYFVFVDGDNTVSARASGEITIEQFRAYVDALQ
jgi:thiol-disulfide isomerase/thioredoxin